MADKRHRLKSPAPISSPTPSATPAPSTPPALYIPVGRFVLVGLLALAIGVLASFWVGTTLLAVAACISVAIVYWARRHGDLLVVSLALLMFWLPFYFTESRLNISPQELATYGIFLIAAAVDRRGILHWLTGIFSTIPVAARFAVILFALAVVQSIARVSHPTILLVVGGLRAMVIYPIVLALLIAYAIYTRRCERLLITAFFWGGALLATYALALQVWGVPVANGAVEGRLGAEQSLFADWHPNNLSLYLAFTLAFAPAMLLSAYREERVRSQRIARVGAVLVASALMLLAVWLTYSRGALVALVLSCGLALVFFIAFGRARQRLVSAGIVFVGIAGAAGFLLVKGLGALGRYGDLLNPTALSSDPNVQFRTQLYDRAIQVATDHPFTGIGIGQFSQGATLPFSPHNTYLDLWVTIGLIGLAAFVAVILLGLYTVISSGRRVLRSGDTIELAVLLGLGAAMIAFLIQSFVETFDVEPRIAPAAWILSLAALAIWFRNTQHQRVAVPPPVLDIHIEEDEANEGEAATAEGEAEGETESEAAKVLASPVAAASAAPAAARAKAGGSQTRNLADDDLRAAPVTIVLPAIERPWNFETGPLPAIDNYYDSMTDFELPALRTFNNRKGPARNGSTASPQPKAALPVAALPANASPAAPSSADSEDDDEETVFNTEKRKSVAESMLAKAPTSYIWNQIYSLWFFAVNFVLSVIIARGLSSNDYGIYAVLSTIVSVLLFVFAFGLEDVATVFLPRVLSEQGRGVAGNLVRRFTVQRLVVMAVVGVVFTVGLKFAVPSMQHLGLLPQNFDRYVGGIFGLRPALMALYLGGSSVVTLLTAFFVAVMKSRVTLVVGGLSQLAMVLFTYPLLKLGLGIDAIFLVQGVVSLATAIVYLFQLAPFLRARSRNQVANRSGLRKLMFTAWLTNVTNGALGKQMDIMLMSLFAVSTVYIGYYNLAYQLSNIVSVLLISGLGGVGLASMSAALSAGGLHRLAAMWNASLMMQVLLSVPLQIITFVLADQIISVVYDPRYAGAANLLRIYLAFGILGRFIGGGANQSALYVIGRQRSVLMARWAGLVLNVILDVIFIQVAGPAGALFATGFTQAWVGIIEYLLLRPRVPVRYPSDFCIRVLCISGLPSIVMLWWTPGGLIGLAARGILFVVIFIAGLFIFGLGDADDLTDMINANPKLRKLVNAISSRLPDFVKQRGGTGVALDSGLGAGEA